MSLNNKTHDIKNARSSSTRLSRFVVFRWFIVMQMALATLFLSANMATADAFNYTVLAGTDPASCAGDSSFNPSISNFVVTEQCTGPNDTFTVQMDISATYNGNKTFWDVIAGFATNEGTLTSPEYFVKQSGCLSSGGTSPFTDGDIGQGCDEIQGSGGFSLTATQTFNCSDLLTCEPLTNQDLIYIIGYTTANTTQDGQSQITSDSNRKCFATADAVDIPSYPIVELYKESVGGTGIFAFDFEGGEGYGECPGDGSPQPLDNDLDTASEGNPAGPLFIWTAPDADNNGTYDTDLDITEITIPTGFELDDIQCTDGAGSVGTFDSTTNSISIEAGTELMPGSKISCTATNKAVYNLELVKEVKFPDGVTIPSYTLAGSEAWTLSAGGNIVVDNDLIDNDENIAIADTLTLQSDTYTLSETGGPTNYNWTSLSCSDANGPIAG